MLTKLLLLGGITLAFIPQTFSQLNFWDFPGCQQSCIFSMLNKHDNLGCAWTGYGNPDIACLCSEPNFEYGIRDCILQSCSPKEDNYDDAYLQVCGRQLLGMLRFYDLQSLILRPASTRAPQFTTIMGTSSHAPWASSQSSDQMVYTLPVASSASDFGSTTTVYATVEVTLTLTTTPAAPISTSAVVVTEVVSTIPT